MRPVSATACALLVCGAAACERSPSAAGVNSGVPQSADGRRTSAPGKAMDRAEDLRKEMGEYNQALEDAMSQGTADAPARKAPAAGASPR